MREPLFGNCGQPSRLPSAHWRYPCPARKMICRSLLRPVGARMIVSDEVQGKCWAGTYRHRQTDISECRYGFSPIDFGFLLSVPGLDLRCQALLTRRGNCRALRGASPKALEGTIMPVARLVKKLAAHSAAPRAFRILERRLRS